ncbi:hypothetical protein KCP73_10810 [Salmonella enterica subsp. enterica]|nr:hypothetical protein KCP73_10810 [Salmonella enterica subsp. enterica]
MSGVTACGAIAFTGGACNTASTVSLPHYVKEVAFRWWALCLRLNQRRG